MEQPVEFLEQLVGTTGRFVPAGCSDQLFRPVVPKNKKFFDGTSGRNNWSFLFWPVVPRRMIINRSKSEQLIWTLLHTFPKAVTERFTFLK